MRRSIIFLIVLLINLLDFFASSARGSTEAPATKLVSALPSSLVWVVGVVLRDGGSAASKPLMSYASVAAGTGCALAASSR